MLRFAFTILVLFSVSVSADNNCKISEKIDAAAKKAAITVKDIGGKSLYHVAPLNGQKSVSIQRDGRSLIGYGQHVGASPLYIAQEYGILLNRVTYGDEKLFLNIRVFSDSTDRLLSNETIEIPNRAQVGVGNSVDFGPEQRTSPTYKFSSDYGLLLKIMHTKNVRNEYALVLKHQGFSTGYRFEFGFVNSQNSNQFLMPICSMSFSAPLPWQIASLQMSRFFDYLPSARQRTEGFGSIKGAVGVNFPKADANLLHWLRSNLKAGQVSLELRSHPILNQLVKDLNDDPLAITSFVFNEIQLTQGITPYLEPGGDGEWAINASKLDRGAVGTYLERRGSAWEQCALLVYLLRQAGYAAAYATLPPQHIQMSFEEASSMLGMQMADRVDVHGVRNPELNQGNGVFINYPGVAFWDEKTNHWRLLFPWLQLQHIHEGHEPYQFLPTTHNSAEKWIRRYLENDPDIMKHVGLDGNNTLGVLFKRYLEEALSKKNMTLFDVGIHSYPQKRQFRSWDELPSPPVVVGNVNFIGTLSEKPELFSAVNIEVTSVQNPNKKAELRNIPSVLLHNSPIWVSFALAGNTNNTLHKLTLNGQSLGMSSMLADETDRAFRVTIRYTGGLDDMFEEPFTYTIPKGPTAAICINFGHVTSEMLDVHAQNIASAKGVNNNDLRLGLMAYLLGMNFFKKMNESEFFLRRLHKVYEPFQFGAGLGKLSPNLALGSANIDNNGRFVGEPELRFPQVDMQTRTLCSSDYRTHRDRVCPEELDLQPYQKLGIVDSSSNEHQIINDMFGERNAVSTARLLQLAHKKHISEGRQGVGFLVFDYTTRLENPIYGNTRVNIEEVKKHAGTQWHELKKVFDTSVASNTFPLGYMTPFPIESENGDYTGMGTFIFDRKLVRAMISSNGHFMHGGYGSKLPKEVFSRAESEKIRATRDRNGEFRFEGFEGREYFDFSQCGGFHDHVVQQSVFVQSDEPGLKRFGLDRYGNYWDQSWVGADPTKPYMQSKDPNWGEPVSAGSYSDQPRTNFERMAQQTLGQPASGSNPPDYSNLYQNIANRGPLNPEMHGQHRAEGTVVADPVSVVTGAFYIDAVDITLPGMFPLELKRNYSSDNSLPGDFGYGWKSNLVSHLAVVSDRSDDMLRAADADGTVLTYRKSGQKWVVTPEDNPQATNFAQAGVGQTANVFHNRIEKVVEAGKDVYLLFGADGSRRRFEKKSFPVNGADRERPYLTQWLDAHGNEIKFHFGDVPEQSSWGRIRKVESNNGNAITFEYDSNQRISRVFTVDGRSVKYSYDRHGDLISVENADGSAVEYKYEQKIEVKPDSNLLYSTHRIIEERKPEGRRLVNGYDNEGRIISQKATVGAGTELYENARFTYSKQSNGVSITDVLTPDGQGNFDTAILTRYKIFQGLVFSTRDPNGKITARDWYLDKNTYFDSDSEQVYPAKESRGYYRSVRTEVDKRGLKTDYEYDDAGNVVTLTLSGNDLFGDGKNASVSSFYQYDPQTHLLTLEWFKLKSGQKKSKEIIYDSQFKYRPAQIIESVDGEANKKILHSYDSKPAAKGLLVQTKITGRGLSIPLTTSFDYNDVGLMIERVMKAGTSSGDVTERYEYNALNQVTKVLLDSGFWTHYEYDILGKPVTIIWPEGDSLKYSNRRYNSNGELIHVWRNEPVADNTFFYYDRAGRIIAEMTTKVDPTENLKDPFVLPPSYDTNHLAITLHEYDVLGNRKRSIDPRGAETQFTYDQMQRVKLLSQGERNKGYTYEAGGLKAQEYSQGKLQRSFSYTTNGLLKNQTNPDGTVDWWMYDEEGRVVEEFVSNMHWRIDWDPKNLIETRASASGRNEVRHFDCEGKILLFKDSAGYVTAYTYDGLGRILSKSEPEGLSTQYTYDSRRNSVTRTNALGNTITEQLDGMGREKERSVQNAQGKEVRYNSYSYSNSQSVRTDGRDLDQTLTITTFDNHRRPLYQFRNVGVGLPFVLETYWYDKSGNVVKKRNLEGETTEYQYDDFGQLALKTLPSGRRFSFEYDFHGNLARGTFSDFGVSASVYNDVGQLLEETLSSGDDRATSRSFAYDKGRAVSLVENGRETHFSYTSDNRVENIKVNESTRQMEYDSRGYITSIREHSQGHESVVSRKYNGNGVVISETVTVDGKITQSFEQNFDKAGRRIGLRHHNENVFFSYDYDADNRVVTVDFNGDQNVNYVYGLDGLLKQRFHKNGSVVLKQDKNWGRTNERISNFAGELFSESIVYGHSGRIESHKLGDEEKSFKYDADGRLQSLVSNVQGPHLFTYSDLDGVSRGSTDNGSHVAYAKGVATRETLKTSQGEMRNYRWDDFGRLVGVEVWNPNQKVADWEAFYDGLGRRIRTIYSPVNGEKVITTSLFDPSVEFLEIGVDITVGARHSRLWKVYGPDLNGHFGGLQGIGGLEAIVDDEQKKTIWFASDALGNIVATQAQTPNQFEKLKWRSDPVGPYGNYSAESFAKLFTFHNGIDLIDQVAASTEWRGHRVDPTGLYNLGARHYSPQNGMFLSPDPLGFAAGPYLYGFAGFDPLNFIDPDGRCASSVGKAIYSHTLGSPRFMGGVQATLGAIGFAGSAAFGAATSWTGVGAAAGGAGMWISADAMGTGLTTMIRGEPTPSVTNRLLQSAGASPQVANNIEMVVGLAAGAAGIHVAGRVAVSQVSNVVLDRSIRLGVKEGLQISGERTWQAAGISASDARRIQQAATATKQEIIVVGSRASGTSHQMSDWDFILSGGSDQRHAAKWLLPKGVSGGEVNSRGLESGVDIWQSHNPNARSYNPLEWDLPHVVIRP